eukprot:545603_1
MIEVTLLYTGSCVADITTFYDKENPSDTLCSFNDVSSGDKITCADDGNVFGSEIYWEINCKIIKPRLLLSSSSSSSSSSSYETINPTKITTVYPSLTPTSN